MARKTSSSTAQRSPKTRKTPSKSQTAGSPSGKPSSKPKQDRSGGASGRQTAKSRSKGGAAKSAKPKAPVRKAPAAGASTPESEILTAIETLDRQVKAVLGTVGPPAADDPAARPPALVRAAPLDRATATFQRLVADLVDEQLAEMLPPLIALRSEFAQRAGGSDDESFERRGLGMIDHVLSVAGVERFEARRGDIFDPLIHLAVGEVTGGDLDDGVVAEPLDAGFRSARRQVLSKAKIRVNRR